MDTAEDIARSIVSAAQPSQQFSTLRVRGDAEDHEFPRFSVKEVTGGGLTDFESVVDAINHLHKNGYTKLNDEENKQWTVLMNGGLDVFAKKRITVKNPAFSVFVRDQAPVLLGATSASFLTASNMAISVANEAERLMLRPQLAVIYSAPSNDRNNNIFRVAGIEGHQQTRFRTVEDAIKVRFEAEFIQRMPMKAEDEWKHFINTANKSVGPDDWFGFEIGDPIGIFTK